MSASEDSDSSSGPSSSSSAGVVRRLGRGFQSAFGAGATTTKAQETSSGRNIGGGLRIALTVVGSFMAVSLFLSFLTDVSLLDGLFSGVDRGVYWGILIVGVVLFGYYADGISVGFAFTFVAALFLVGAIAPAWLVEPFAFIPEALFGTTSLGIDPVTFAVLAVATVLLYWAISIRLWGRGKKPAAVTNQMRKNAQSLVRQYAKIAATVAGFFAATLFIVGGQGGNFLGEVFMFMSNAPVVSTYATTLVAGFGTFVEGWPVLGGLTATQFGLIAVALFLLGVAMKYTGVLDN